MTCSLSLISFENYETGDIGKVIVIFWCTKMFLFLGILYIHIYVTYMYILYIDINIYIPNWIWKRNFFRWIWFEYESRCFVPSYQWMIVKPSQTRNEMAWMAFKVREKWTRVQKLQKSVLITRTGLHILAFHPITQLTQTRLS